MGNFDMNKIKIGIIGVQHLHPRSYMTHFRSMEDVEVTCVADPDSDLLQRFATDFQLRAYADWRELLQHERLDLVAIFLPHVDCPTAAVEAIHRGIHVMVEKPMAADSRSAEHMVLTAEAKNVLLTTPYVWRYHPVVQDIKKLIREGVLGQIIGCEGRCAAGRLHRYIEGHAAWMLDTKQSGGGPMYNLGVHWIDLFCWLLEQPIVRAFGKNVKINQTYHIEDNSFAILRFQNGAILNLDISYTVPDSYPHGRDLYLGIRGTKGVIQWAPAYEGERDELFICSDHEHFRSAPRQRRYYELFPSPGYSGVMGLEYLKAVVKAIQTKLPPPISGQDGVRVLKIVEAIYRSDQMGREVAIEECA